MVKKNGTSPGPEPVIPLGYGRGNVGGDFGRRVSAAFDERFDGVAEFGGMLIEAVGGRRQFAFALGLALAAYGLGLILARPHADGPGWLAIGVFVIGLVVPAPARRPDGGGTAGGSSAARDASSPK